MPEAQPPIAVVGPGAVGGLLAALLHRDGADAVVVARESSAKRIAERGLTIRSGRYGDWDSAVPAVTSAPEGAHVVLATKAYAVAEVATRLADDHPAEVLSLLNGVEHIATLRAALPDTRIIGAAIAIEALRVEPTVLEHRSAFARLTVPADAAESPLAAALAHAGVDVVVGGSENEVLWTKLRFLAPHALLTSRTQTGIGDAIADDPALTAALLDEIAAVATAEGLATTGAELFGILDGMPAGMRSSLQADLAAGGDHEVDAIGGAVARAGRRHGILTPTLDALVEQLSRPAPPASDDEAVAS